MIEIVNIGAGSALLGKEAAMACTVAIEASITEHYNKFINFEAVLLNHNYKKSIFLVN